MSSTFSSLDLSDDEKKQQHERQSARRKPAGLSAEPVYVIYVVTETFQCPDSDIAM